MYRLYVVIRQVKLTSGYFLSDTTGWGVSPRGAGYLFGSDVVSQFNQSNDIDMICRAHQLVMEGYKWHFNETVLTVWSAPNYCYRYVRYYGRFSMSERILFFCNSPAPHLFLFFSIPSRQNIQCRFKLLGNILL